MAVVNLLDVNVMVALFDADHVHHDLAHDWFAEEGSAAWATCPMTEAGFLRVVTNPAYRGSDVRASTLLSLLRRFCASKEHHFWSDAVSLRDAKQFDLSFISGHQQLTDVYLVGLAHHMNGRLVTFDRTIPLKAVVGAKSDALLVISA